VKTGMPHLIHVGKTTMSEGNENTMVMHMHLPSIDKGKFVKNKHKAQTDKMTWLE